MADDFFNEDIDIPHNLQIEKLVLGSLLNNNLLYEEVIFLKESDFFEQFHQKLFKKIVSKINDGQLADKLTLTEFCFKNEVNISYLTEICDNFTSTIKAYGETLRDIAKRRQMLKIGKELIKAASDDVKIADQISTAERQIFEMQVEGTEYNSKFISLAKGMTEVLDNVILNLQEGKKIGLQSGFSRLDDLLGGFRKGELFVLAGRPATGKTAFALNIALNISKNRKYGGKVLFVSLEMSYEQICGRAISLLASVPLNHIVHANLSKEALANCRKAAYEFRDVPLFIKDCSFITISTLKTFVRQIKRNNGIDLLIIDYLQLIETVSNKNENRETEISRISRGLKLMAKELELPIIALSQLSRDIEKRKDSPRLSDLRGSGALEQDADNIGILYIPDEEVPNNVVLHLGKNRNGATGEIPLLFENEMTRFSNAILI